MSRKFISVVLAASIAVTAISAPQAQAGNRDLNRFLAGVAAIAIIGAIVEGKSNAKRQTYQRNQFSTVPQPGPHPLPGPNPRQRHISDRKLLPSKCLTSRYQNGQRRAVFMGRCIERNYQYSRSLPEQCAILVPRQNGSRYTQRAFRAYCLEQYGYRAHRG